MRPTLILVALTLMTAQLTAAQAVAPQPLPDAAINAAIARGTEKKEPVVLVVGDEGKGFGAALLRAGSPTYSLYVQGPAARIQTLAAAHAKKYMPFTADSVSPAMRLPYLMVRAVPGKPRQVGGKMLEAAPITHVVLQGRGKQASGEPWPVVQPVRVEQEAVTWENVFGATYTGVAFNAFFDLSQLPDEDIDVVVVNTGDEKRYRIRKNELAEVR